MKTRPHAQLLMGVIALVASALTIQAQWVAETLHLKAGWNSVYLHIECPQATIDELAAVAGPLQEVWLWNPAPTLAQFVQSAQEPTATGSQWLSWKRAEGANQFDRLVGNAAYLVRVSEDFEWALKGRPVAPRHQWSTTGINFFGFPMAPDSTANFEVFFEHVPDFRRVVELFYYTQAELGSSNPMQLAQSDFPTKRVKRNEAYWMRAENFYNKYFGPFEVSVQGSLDFGQTVGQRSFRIRNMALSTNVITLKYLASESAPEGQRPIVDAPALLVRGALNTTNLTYGYSTIHANDTFNWTLSPVGTSGSEVEVVLGVNRYSMGHQAGDLLAGVLRLTDFANYSQVDLPLSVEVNSTTGLWIGSASLTSVNSYLKSYKKEDDGVLSVDAAGKYIVTSTNTNSAPVAKAFPLRLILHNDGTNTVLLQRVYHGLNSANEPIIALQEASLDASKLSSARRISAPHLPWSSANTLWPMTGSLNAGSTLNVDILLSYSDQASNPFLHTYHPDHDNLNATFDAQLEQGEESFSITRKLFLTISPPADDFTSLTITGTTLTGVYAEEMTLGGKGSESRTFHADGPFALKRISPIAKLTP